MNDFIWTDLSTNKVKESLDFYSQLFDWKFEDFENYYVGRKNGNAEIGIYKTPAFFQKIKMPHFWMNYIHVENLEDIVSRVTTLNGKVEIKDAPFYGGRMALIRDPMGAGFTIYEGTDLAENKSTDSFSINLRELHTSNSSIAINFYSELLNWKFTSKNESEYLIKNEVGIKIGNLLEISNEEKGKYEYWVTEFYVDNYTETKDILVAFGGEVISDEAYRVLATDKFKEAFFYISSIRKFR